MCIVKGMKKEYRINAEQEWRQVAEDLIPRLKTGTVVTLTGPLGAGKTTFVRFLVRLLAGEEIDVPSPTFTLVQEYRLPEFDLWHFDLYRLEESEADVLELGWEDARRYGVALVEWPDRLGALLPRQHLALTIMPEGETQRRAILEEKI